MGYILGVERRDLRGTGVVAPRTVIDTIDPRARILAAVAIAFAVVALKDLVLLLLALGLSLALMATARMPVRQTLRRMLAMDGFIIFMLVLLPFTVPGEPIFEVFGQTASWSGLHKAIEIALKANAIILALMSLVGSMDPVTLGHALRRLWVPATLVHLLMFTVRYIEVLRREYLRLRCAMKARGFRPRNTRHTYRSFGYLVGMMLVRAVERSERILAAMKCRGFNGQIPLLDTLAFTVNDLIFGLVLSTILAVLITVQGL